MAKVGRPEYKVTQEVIDKVYSLARLLLNMKQIAACLGIGYETLFAKKRQFKKFSDAIKKGRADGLAELAADLRQHQKATPAVAIFKAKCHLGWRENEDSAFAATDGEKTFIFKKLDPEKDGKRKKDK